MAASYSNHQQWIASLREAHAARVRPTQNSPRACPVGGPAAALPLAPQTWREASEEAVYCEEDEGLPIYRSLADLYDAADEWVDMGPTVDDTVDVFRSLNLSDLSSEEGQAPPPGADDAEAEWLLTMPPLVQRQRAFTR